MIDIRKLKELVRLMVASELTELDLRDSEEQVTLRRQRSSAPAAAVDGLPEMTRGTTTQTAVPTTPARADAGRRPGVSIAQEAGLVTITSPMVGTFYAAASPEASPFVHEGSSVAPESVVCIIEAMKIFNEIRAECTGTIVKAMVANGDPVEFGQPLFMVRPV
jgi:acetyl-CoA carboxylase biotin carboxyl carrier protein